MNSSHLSRIIRHGGLCSVPFVLAVSVTAIAVAQTDYADVEISTTDIGNGVYMLVGEGGNVGVSVGDDGVFMIDDQFAPLSTRLTAAIAELSDQPVTYLLNTHWHFDHTGGNENFGEAGAVIVAHDNVRERMSTDQFIGAFQREVPASPEAALPVITFTDNATFHFNDQTIDIRHVATAHTDGDSLVHFPDTNALHTGDTFFNGFFPFIDASSGGSLAGMIGATDIALELVDGQSKIIPGHGPLATRDDLSAYRDMLVKVKSIMEPLVAGDESRERVLSEEPLAELGKTWGGGFLDTDRFTALVYDSLAGD